MTTTLDPSADDLDILFPLPSPTPPADDPLDLLFPLPEPRRLPRPRHGDRGSALTMLVGLAALAGLGAVLMPKAAALAGGEVAQVDLAEAAQALQESGQLTASAPAAEAVLAADDPGLPLSGSPAAGPSRAIGLPGSAGVVVPGPGEVVLVVEAGEQCWRAVVGPSTTRVTSERLAAAGACRA